MIEKVGTATFLAANPRIRAEEVRAFQLGTRSQPLPSLSLSMTAFYNDYASLRPVDPASSTVLLFYCGNPIKGDAYGIDTWGNWQASDWWRISPGVSCVHERLKFKPGVVALLGISQAGDDPSSQATLSSSFNLPRRLSLDASLRDVGALPDPALPHYMALDVRLGWQASKAIELSVQAANLLNARHIELPHLNGEQALRSVIGEARIKFYESWIRWGPISRNICRHLAILGLLAVSSWVFPARAVESYTEESVKASFLYRFAGYVEWPERMTVDAPFDIEVLGAPAVARELRRLLPGHPIHGRLAEVQEISNARNLGVAQISYMGAGHAEAVRALAPTPGLSSVLLVTDEEGGLNGGAAINFLTLDRSIRFDASVTNAERWGSKINADLLGAALRAQRGHRISAITSVPMQLVDTSRRAWNPAEQDRG